MASLLTSTLPGHRCNVEFERLANRRPSQTEKRLLELAAGKQAVWAEGLRPDALVLLAMSLSQTAARRVLFVSPDFELLLQRQHRWGARAATHLLPEAGPVKIPAGAATIFCSAATLLNDQFQRGFELEPPDVVVVEQAHAASSSAFEYRPGLLKIAELSLRWQRPVLVAGAARSTPGVREKACELLGISKAVSLVERFSALSLQVLPEMGGSRLSALIAALPRPALILCSTPTQADAVYAELNEQQLPCHRYHAGLSAKERATELLQFVLPGRRAILVATSSFGPASGWAGEHDGRLSDDFGRGYGRCDLRTLVHVGMPTSVEQYGQELSLLKHDEQAPETCFAVTLFSHEHVALNSALLSRKRPCVETLQAVVKQLKAVARGGWVHEHALASQSGGTPRAVQLILRFLKDWGAIESSIEAGQIAVRAVSLAALTHAHLQLDQAFREIRRQDQLREERLVRFAQTPGCRWAAFQRALGQPGDDECGKCDRCDPSARLVAHGEPLGPARDATHRVAGSAAV